LRAAWVTSQLHRFNQDQDDRRAHDSTTACLSWRLPRPLRCASTASVGGGIGLRDWVLNVEVPLRYARKDLGAHIGEVACVLGLRGEGVGMLTAASVAAVSKAHDGDVSVEATVGLSWPVWAAAPEEAEARAVTPSPGTVNVVAYVPACHDDAALANLLCTMTEAKVQALLDGGVSGTGTASDAMTVLCPSLEGTDGVLAERFGGPRSVYGAPLARAVYAAVAARIGRP
jgi:adenosylcobinamide hydrolase